MKRVFLTVSVVFNLNLALFAQTKVEFEKFIGKFPVYDNYPYIRSQDYDKMTIPGKRAGRIDEIHLKTFIYDQGIKMIDMGCGVENFEEYVGDIQFPHTDSAYLVTIFPTLIDACGEGLLLVSYSKYDYKIRDTLWIDSDRRLPVIKIDDNMEIPRHLTIESISTKDSIYVEKEIDYYLRELNPRHSKRVKVTKFYTTYKITTGGKFVIIRERKEDEILDTFSYNLDKILHEKGINF